MSNQYSVALRAHEATAVAANANHPGNPRPEPHRRGQASSKAHSPARGSAPRKDYTLGHAGRQVRLGPVAFWIVVSVLVIMAGWSAVTATYFTFRDDLLTRLIGRQADMQYAYEDRIAELRAQVDRVTSRQLLDQDQVEQRIETLRRRQATLEERASALATLPDTAATGSLRAAGRPAQHGDAAAQPAKPSPIDGTPSVLPERRRGAMLDTPAGGAARGKPLAVPAALARLESSLDRVELRQMAALRSVESTYEGKVRRMRGVFSELGIDPRKLPPGADQKGVGGPFIPLQAHEGTPFAQQMQRVQFSRLDAERLTHALITVPVRRPLAGDPDTTSGFGVRYDPFLRTPALHSGLDFRGPVGEPVHATAAGVVTNAGWNGGYGRMVEIDHGNGFATRYGHMSEITVTEGQSVRIGQVVGRIGSTGRSTGPHLHYETRIDGEAVDPQRFLRAGLRLGEAL